MNPDTPRSGIAANNAQEERAGEPRNAASSVEGASLSDAVPGVDTGAASAERLDATERERTGPRKVVAQLKEKTASQLDAQRQRASWALGSVVAAARDTSRQLRGERRNAAANVVETAANQIDRLSEQLRNKDLEELADEARHFARQRPALFIGTSVVAGFVATRFARSSNQEQGWSRDRAERAPRRPSSGERSGGAAAREWPGDSHSNSGGTPRGSF
jgi:hypothetical protein